MENQLLAYNDYTNAEVTWHYMLLLLSSHFSAMLYEQIHSFVTNFISTLT